MFEVVKAWANWDATHEVVVASFSSKDDALRDAKLRLEQQALPWNAFVVRPKKEVEKCSD